jgi:hypothetical protein
MNGIMKSIESCHGAPCILNKDLILNDEFYNLTFLRFNLASDTVFMSKISKIRFQKGHSSSSVKVPSLGNWGRSVYSTVASIECLGK